jgi:hypothetical protein
MRKLIKKVLLRKKITIEIKLYKQGEIIRLNQSSQNKVTLNTRNKKF